jgi:phospholipid/cholesterol/gamma-HCH transport system substrate-binding protein
MDERVAQFRVGVMILATILITIILVFLFGEGPQTFGRRIAVRIVFTEAPMVMVNTPVKKSGVVIGRVTGVTLLDDGRVSVSASIDDDKPVFTTDVARISASLIGGDASVNFEAGRKAIPRDRVADGVEIEGMGYTDPIQVIGNLQDRLSGAIGSVTNTSTELGQVVHQVGELLKGNQERINRIVSQTDEASRDAKEMVRNLNEVFASPETKAKLKDATDQLPLLIRTTRETVGEAGKVMAGFDRNLQNLDKFTTALGDQGQALIGRLGQSSEKLDRLADQMLVLTENINNGKGTLGQLVVDRELYDNLKRTVATVESLTRELRPILGDVRVFTDSIARHPEKLGVRGALQPSNGTKW